MFKHSFFYKYLTLSGGFLLLNVLLRIASVVLTVAVLVGVAPMFSLLFGTMAGSSGDAQSASDISGVAGSNAVMQDLIVFLDRGFAQMVTHYGSIHTLLIVISIFALLFLLKNIFDYLGLYSFTPVRTRAVENIRNDLYQRLLILPLSFFSKNKRGDLLSRIGSDIQEIDETILKSVGTSIGDFVMFNGLVVCLFLISIPLAAAMILILPLAVWVIGLTSRSLKRRSPAMQKALGHLTAFIEESMRGVKTIFAYNNVAHSTAKFDEENAKFTRIKTSVYQRTDLGSPVSEIVGTFFIMLLLVAGGWLIFNGGNAINSMFALKPEAFIVFLLILVQLIVPAKNLANAWFNIKRGHASVVRIKEVLNADEVITQVENALAIHDLNDCIEFKNVSFRYDVCPSAMTGGNSENTSDHANCEVAALKNISLTIKKGQHIAFAGLSGAGKSTLINLIPRFYDPTQGEVLIDGKNIKECQIDDIRALSSLISQDTILFNDTFHNNIRFGREDATQAEIEQAAKKACAHDFIIATEKGYDTVVGNSGVKLSGGERQRISIARALLKDAPILILDEASASLDTQAEQCILRAVASLKDKIVVTIAHRLSTIRDADHIYVMENGNIVESGTHEQLAAANGRYKNLLNNG